MNKQGQGENMSGNENEGNAPTDSEKVLGESAEAERAAEDANVGGLEFCPPADFAPSEVDKTRQAEVLASPHPMLAPEMLPLAPAEHPLVVTAANEEEGHFGGPDQSQSLDDFSDLLAIDWDQKIAGDSPDAALTEAIIKKLERIAFAGFESKPDGKLLPFKATLSEEQLLRVDNLLLATYDNIGKHPCLVRVVVTTDQLLIQANSVIAVLQHRIHLDEPTGLAENARSTFYIAAIDFHQAVKACAGQATLAWEAGEALVFASGLFERDIVLRPVQQFQNLSKPIVAELSGTPIGLLPVDALADALRYGWPLLDGFNKRTFEPAVIESTGGGVVSMGRPGAMAVVSAESLKNFAYSIRGKQASSLKTALTTLEQPSELFQDTRHYILWDGVTAIGFDREHPSLESARKIWEAAEWGPSIMALRNELIYSLRQISVLSGSESFELQVKGSGKATITISAASGTRRRARTVIEGFSQSIIPLTRLTLPVWPTVVALLASDTGNARIRLSSLGLMIDDSDGKPSGRHFINGKKASAKK